VGTEPLSPELALVCPELRAAAIAVLPDRDPDAWLDRPPARETSPVYDLMAAICVDELSIPENAAPLPVALLAYTLTSTTRFALEAAAFVGIVIGLLSIVTLMHT
jgi:hypothetical protein